MLKQGLTPHSAGWGREPEENWGTLNTSMNELHVVGRVETLAGSYQSYYENVRDCILGRAELAVKPEEARMAIRLIELARLSNEQQRTVEVTR